MEKGMGAMAVPNRIATEGFSRGYFLIDLIACLAAALSWESAWLASGSSDGSADLADAPMLANSLAAVIFLATGPFLRSSM